MWSSFQKADTIVSLYHPPVDRKGSVWYENDTVIFFSWLYIIENIIMNIIFHFCLQIALNLKHWTITNNYVYTSPLLKSLLCSRTETNLNVLLVLYDRLRWNKLTLGQPSRPSWLKDRCRFTVVTEAVMRVSSRSRCGFTTWEAQGGRVVWSMSWLRRLCLIHKHLINHTASSSHDRVKQCGNNVFFFR